MAFSYSGNLMEAWAQLTLHGIRGGGSASVFFAVLNQPRANTIETVWWAPRNSEALIALGNSSNQPINATLIFSNGETRETDIAPFATQIVRRSENSGQSHDNRATGVSINYTGPQGSLIPTGFMSSANGKFTSNIRFYNTPNSVQPNLYANNLRLKDTVPRMVLRNTSPDFVTAQPRFLTAAGTPSEMVKLPTLRLKPNEIVEVDLRPLMVAERKRSDLDSVSVQVLNSGAPGSLIGALYSQDRRTGVAYDVPLRDSGSPRTSTGAYPVRVDSDYTTVLSITNVTDKQGEFSLQINYEGGTYELGLVTANPGETRNFDIRRLRDDQTPDRNGRPFPRDLSTGQIRWSLRGNGSVPLFGRSEVVSLREGVSSSYSCPTCCPSTFYDGWLDPGYSSIFEGDSQQLLGQERQRDCYGNIYGPYETSWGFWYGANPDIATMDANGQATGISEGTAGFSFTWTTYYWMMDFDEQCIPFESSETGNSTMQVAVRPVRYTTVTQESNTAFFSAGFGGQTWNATLSLPSNSAPCTGTNFSMHVNLHKESGTTLNGTFHPGNIPSTPSDSQYQLLGGGLQGQGGSSPYFPMLLKRIAPGNPNRHLRFPVSGTTESGAFTAVGFVTINCN